MRLSYAQDPNGFATRILEENHYYPFGLKHTNYDNGTQRFMRGIGDGDDDFPIFIAPDIFGSGSYTYKYNGKELQDELGLNFYDYGARNYDPALGRWMNIDPLAEKYYDNSTYNYAINNPVFFIDPNGQEVDVSSLFNSDKKEDRWLLAQLMLSLKDITGMTITTSSDKEGKTTLKAKKDKKITNSSSSASKYVSHLFTMKERITVQSTDENTSTDSTKNNVFLNFAQIKGMQNGLEKQGIDKDVMSVGMAFLHETIHTKPGADWWKNPQIILDKNEGRFFDYGESPGFVEKRINGFRQQLGLPTSYRYGNSTTLYILVKGEKVEVPYTK